MPKSDRRIGRENDQVRLVAEVEPRLTVRVGFLEREILVCHIEQRGCWIVGKTAGELILVRCILGQVRSLLASVYDHPSAMLGTSGIERDEPSCSLLSRVAVFRQ
ncbi:hypothetical protein [Hyella patelloides]|uniref:hypothetical protein n=1 Tax=Hyella patelloides TaxID=1982969 RepID=UPI00119DBB1F|nr:hypothetical protein [Hyella patelloides]